MDVSRPIKRKCGDAGAVSRNHNAIVFHFCNAIWCELKNDLSVALSGADKLILNAEAVRRGSDRALVR